MEKKKAVRSLKVYGQGGYGQNGTPMIMLKGNWLQQLGFEIGDYILVICENGKCLKERKKSSRSNLRKNKKSYTNSL